MREEKKRQNDCRGGRKERRRKNRFKHMAENFMRKSVEKAAKKFLQSVDQNSTVR